MTVTPTMTPKTTFTGLLLAVIGAGALAAGFQMIDLPLSGNGWRGGAATPVMVETPAQARGSNAEGAAAILDADVIASRARN